MTSVQTSPEHWLKKAYGRDKESLRVFAVGVITYFAPEAAMRLGARWFAELADSAAFRDRYHTLRRKFWRGFITAVSVSAVVLGVLALNGHYVKERQSWLRILAAVVALTATLGRGGWDIQSIKNKTVVERIDRGMYLIGQLGALTILLLILGW